MDKLLFQKSTGYESKNQKFNYENQIYVNKTRGKKDPKTRIEIIQNRKKKPLDTSDYSNKDRDAPKIADYFDNARRISAEEDTEEIIPKIEISLNE